MKKTIPIIFEIENRWVKEGEKRFKASSFSPKTVESLALIDNLKNKGMHIKRIDNIVKNIFYPPRFKRLYEKKGTKFLSSKEIFDFLPIGKRIKNISEEYLVKSNWILVTRSGSVGRVLITNNLIVDVAVSEHVIRIVPNKDTPIGYLYAYLISKMGQSLLVKNIFGGVVDEIEPHHLANILIPHISELEEEINRKILKVCELRERAQKLLLKAIEILHSELGLPKIDEGNVDYFGEEKGEIIKAFEIKTSELNSRLDASYHKPLVKMALKKMGLKKEYSLVRLEELAYCFVPGRFKRPYVDDPKEGVPLLQGSHIPQIKLYGLKYIWHKMKNIESFMLKKNWIVVTCSGTVGRLAIVRDHWDGWASPNHLIRIIPKREKIHPGFLFAFLFSIYGQTQFERLTYGGVVDEIGEAGELFNEIMILKPPNEKKDIEEKIGELIFEAYDKKDKANRIEEETIKLLENKLMELAEN